jgi:hypothetical protein
MSSTYQPDGPAPNTLATPGDILVRAEPEDFISAKEQFKYHLGVGKLLHMMCWSRPKILNAVQELFQYMSGASVAHVKAMQRTMKYCVGTPERGLFLKQDCE